VTRTPRRFRRSYASLAAVASVVALAGCGGGSSEEPTQLTGLIVDIQGRGNNVRSFTLRSGDKTYDIRIAPDVDYGFQLGHLRAHESSLYPVRCTLERRAGRLYALEILDA
jgi:hypothetical protein